MTDPTCVYCKLPRKAHAASAAGPTWFTCPDGTARPVHLDTHFRREADLGRIAGEALKGTTG